MLEDIAILTGASISDELAEAGETQVASSARA